MRKNWKNSQIVPNLQNNMVAHLPEAHLHSMHATEIYAAGERYTSARSTKTQCTTLNEHLIGICK